MGFLDDLKNQADGLKQRQMQEQERQQALQTYYQQEIHPRMVEIYNYLNEMVKHLNYLKPDTRAHYPVLPEGRTANFHQSDYKVVIDSSQCIRNITLKFSCSLHEKQSFGIEGKERIATHKEWLDAFNIKYHRKDNKDENYELIDSEFILEGPINVSVQFTGDIENSAVNLFFRNFEKPGITKYVLKARHMDKTFLDMLGRYLLREDDNFLNLDISDNERQTIREKLQQEKARLAQELKEAELAAMKEQAEERKSFLDLFNKKNS